MRFSTRHVLIFEIYLSLVQCMKDAAPHESSARHKENDRDRMTHLIVEERHDETCCCAASTTLFPLITPNRIKRVHCTLSLSIKSANDSMHIIRKESFAVEHGLYKSSHGLNSNRTVM